MVPLDPSQPTPAGSEQVLYPLPSYKTYSLHRYVHKIAKKQLLALSCLYVYLSISLHGKTQLRLDGFSWNLTFEYFFQKYVKEIQVSFTCDKNNGYFT